MNFLSQSGQTNGFSPVWILRCTFKLLVCVYFFLHLRDGVSLKTPRPRGWVGAGRPSGCKSSFNKRNMYQYPHVSQLFILLPWQSRVYPEPLKVVEFVQLTTECCWGQPSDPCPARMPYISRLCDVGATDVKRWWWWWWWIRTTERLFANVNVMMHFQLPTFFELFVTIRTYERRFTGMDSTMHIQISIKCERRPLHEFCDALSTLLELRVTIRTGEWCFTSVKSTMHDTYSNFRGVAVIRKNAA